MAAKAAKPKYVKPAGKGNWLPIYEYFYGRKNGDPAYVEQKGEFRFKCWHCEKMLYNNLKVGFVVVVVVFPSRNMGAVIWQSSNSSLSNLKLNVVH